MNKIPAYQRYSGKWLADTRRLSWSAKGIYADILEIIWLQFQDTCTIPDDDEYIASELGCTIEIWQSAKVEICNERRPLLTQKSGGLFNKGLWKEHEKAIKYRQKQAANGRMGGRPKKPKKASLSLSLDKTPLPPKEKRQRRGTGSLGADTSLRDEFKKSHPAYAELVKSVHFVGVSPDVYSRVVKTWPNVNPMKGVEKAVSCAELMIHGVNEPGLFLNSQFSKLDMEPGTQESESERIKRRDEEFNKNI